MHKKKQFKPSGKKTGKPGQAERLTFLKSVKPTNIIAGNQASLRCFVFFSRMHIMLTFNKTHVAKLTTQ